MENSREKTLIKREFIVIFLIVSTIFMALALATYSPRDPALTSHPLTPSRNLMGPVGASLADLLVSVFGYVSWMLPIVLLATVFTMFRKFRSIIPSSLHLWTGTLLFIIGSSTILALAYTGNAMHPGGLLGLYSKKFLEKWIGPGGTLLFAVSCMIFGVFVGTSLEFQHVTALTRRNRGGEVQQDDVADTKPVKTEQAETKGKGAPEAASELPRIQDPKWTRKSKAKDRDQDNDFIVTHDLAATFKLPSLDLLDDPPSMELEMDEGLFYENARTLEQKLMDFGVKGKVVEICPGPVVTMYEFSPAPGVKINKVTSLQDDIALALKSHSVRIVAPIPGKSVIGIELANQKRHTVYLKEILDSDTFRQKRWRLPLGLGKDVIGEPVVTDLARMPHLLIAGATGTGKSVGLNSMICSLLFSQAPNDLRLLMIDPKRIELSLYDGIPHLLHPVVSDPKEATTALKWAVQEMERRYGLLESTGSRNIENYNKKLEDSMKEEGSGGTSGHAPEGDGNEQHPTRPLPYLVIIIDELADLMMVSSKEVEAAIARLAQMARAAGIHLIIATQRPSVDVLTGLIKANFPARISFKVSSKVDSRTILDTMGAERLLGMGDMLFLPPGSAAPDRIHGAFCSETEIKKLTDFWRSQGSPDYDLTVTEATEGDEEGGDGHAAKKDGFSDELYDQAIDIVTQSGQASISMVQRRLRVGYNRAARMIEQMERDGIVSPADSMGRRQVLVRGYSEQ